jgi:hypothetical protein
MYSCGNYQYQHLGDTPGININKFKEFQMKTDNEIFKILHGDYEYVLESLFLKNPHVRPAYKHMLNSYSICSSNIETILSKQPTDSMFESLINQTINSVSEYLTDNILKLDTSRNDFLAVLHGQTILNGPNTLAQIIGLDQSGYGVGPTGVFDVFIDVIYSPNFQGRVSLIPPILLLDVNAYYDSVQMKNYRKWIIAVEKKFIHPGISDIDAGHIADQLISMEKDIIDLGGFRNIVFDPKNSFTLVDLAHKFPNIMGGIESWNVFFRDILEFPPSFVNTMVVHVQDKKYFEGLNSMMSSLSRKTIQEYFAFIHVIQANYVLDISNQWLYPSSNKGNLPLFNSFSFLPSRFDSSNKNENKRRPGYVTRKPSPFNRPSLDEFPFFSMIQNVKKEFSSPTKSTTSATSEAVCFQGVKKRFSYLIAMIYQDLIISDDSLKEIEEIMMTIESTFKNRIMNSTLEPWLTDKSRKLAVKKLEKLKHYIGIPDLFKDLDFSKKVYELLTESKYKYTYLIGRNRTMFSFIMREVQNLNLLPYKLWNTGLENIVLLMFTDWTEANAFYFPMFNTINIPLGLLHPSLLPESLPLAAKYGFLGSILGHEVTHGFDNQGINYDEYGLYNVWMDESSTSQFNQKAQCFKNFYSNYVFDGTHVNGNSTIGENLADNGGLKISWDAYKNTKNIFFSRPQVKLPGLENFTPPGGGY